MAALIRRLARGQGLSPSGAAGLAAWCILVLMGRRHYQFDPV
jgi:hypothetical protein